MLKNYNDLIKHFTIVCKEFYNSTGGQTCQNGGTCTPSGDCCCPTGFSGSTCGTEVAAGSCTESQDTNIYLGGSRMCSGVWTCTGGSKQCGAGYTVSRIINYYRNRKVYVSFTIACGVKIEGNCNYINLRTKLMLYERHQMKLRNS